MISLLPSAEGEQAKDLPARARTHLVPSHVTPSLKFSQGVLLATWCHPWVFVVWCVALWGEMFVGNKWQFLAHSAVTFFGSVIGKLRILVGRRRRQLFWSNVGHRNERLSERKLRVSAKCISHIYVYSSKRQLFQQNMRDFMKDIFPICIKSVTDTFLTQLLQIRAFCLPSAFGKGWMELWDARHSEFYYYYYYLRTYFLTYLLTYLITYVLTYLFTYLLTHLLTCFLTYLLIYSLTYLLTSYLLTHLLTYLLAYSLTYLLTPWCRVLLEKLTGSQLVKKYPALYGTRRFITALTSAHHLSLSWASSIESMPPNFTCWVSILILSHLRLGLPSYLFPSGFPTKTVYTPLLSPLMLHAPPISFFSIWSPE